MASNSFYITEDSLFVEPNDFGYSGMVRIYSLGRCMLTYYNMEHGVNQQGLSPTKWPQWTILAQNLKFDGIYGNTEKVYLYAKCPFAGTIAVLNVHDTLKNDSDGKPYWDGDYYYINIGYFTPVSNNKREFVPDFGVYKDDRGGYNSSGDNSGLSEMFALIKPSTDESTWYIQALRDIMNLVLRGSILVEGSFMMGEMYFNNILGATTQGTISDTSIFTSLRVLKEIEKNNEFLKSIFLSKVEDDEAAGHITFNKGLLAISEATTGLSGAITEDGESDDISGSALSDSITEDSVGEATTTLGSLTNVSDSFDSAKDGLYLFKMQGGIYFPVVYVDNSNKKYSLGELTNVSETFDSLADGDFVLRVASGKIYPVAHVDKGSAQKGYFETETLLFATVIPEIGDTAWCGLPYPGIVYDCIAKGVWRNTGVAPDAESVDLSNYVNYDRYNFDMKRIGEFLKEIEEDGFVICDAQGNVIFKISAVGLDVHKLTDHFLSLIPQPEIPEQKQEIKDIEEDVFVICDLQGNIILQIGKDGLDVHELSQHFLSLIPSSPGGSTDLKDVEEDGFFICDQNGYVVAKITGNGIDSVGFGDNLIEIIKSLIPEDSNDIIIDTVSDERQIGYVRRSVDGLVKDVPFYERNFTLSVDATQGIDQETAITLPDNAIVDEYFSIKVISCISEDKKTVYNDLIQLQTFSQSQGEWMLDFTGKYNVNSIIDVLFSIRYTKLDMSDYNNYTLTIPVSQASDASISFPNLKYDKEHMVSLTADDANASAFSTLWAVINNYPVPEFDYGGIADPNYGTAYHIEHVEANDYPTNIIHYNKILCHTDGCGNDVRFRIGCAVWPTAGSGADGTGTALMDHTATVGTGWRFKMVYLLWNDLKKMFDFDFSMYQHDVNDAKWDATDIEQIKLGLQECQERMNDRVGRIAKALARPSNNELYIAAAHEMDDYKLTTTQGGDMTSVTNGTIMNFPFREQKGNFSRSFANISTFVDAVTANRALAYENRKWIHFGVHTASNNSAEALISLNDLHGKPGADDMWFCTLDEAYEYYFLCQNCVITKTYSGNNLILNIRVPKLLDNFFYKEFCLKLSGITVNGEIQAGEGVYGMSYANKGDHYLINLNLDDTLLERAQRYTETFETKKTELTKGEALYFTNRLKNSADKTSLLNRINAI